MSGRHPAIAEAEVEHVLHHATDVRAWVRSTAEHFGIAFTPGPVDVFVEAVCRLSDAEVKLDDIEQLLAEFKIRGLITGRQSTFLHAAYLRQR